MSDWIVCFYFCVHTAQSRPKQVFGRRILRSPWETSPHTNPHQVPTLPDQDHLREASKEYPEHSQAAEENLADLIRLKTEGTEYSRPLGSVRTRPRTGVIRASKQRPAQFWQWSIKQIPSPREECAFFAICQTKPTLFHENRCHLAKDIDNEKGRTDDFCVAQERCLFGTGTEVLLCWPWCYNMDNWVSDLQSFKKLTNSVLQYVQRYVFSTYIPPPPLNLCKT